MRVKSEEKGSYPPNESLNCVIRVIEMGDDGSEKMPRPSPYADDSDDDAETRATLLDNGVKSAGGTERLDGMAAADRIEAENGKTERNARSR